VVSGPLLKKGTGGTDKDWDRNGDTKRVLAQLSHQWTLFFSDQ
jgi:hypothetical protein